MPLTTGQPRVGYSDLIQAIADADTTESAEVIVFDVLQAIGVQITWPITRTGFEDELQVLAGVPVFEVEEGGGIGSLIGYGHRDRDLFASAANALDATRATDGDPARASDVLLTYAVCTQDPGGPDGPWYEWGVPAGTPNAFPATVLDR